MYPIYYELNLPPTVRIPVLLSSVKYLFLRYSVVKYVSDGRLKWDLSLRRVILTWRLRLDSFLPIPGWLYTALVRIGCSEYSHVRPRIDHLNATLVH